MVKEIIYIFMYADGTALSALLLLLALVCVRFFDCKPTLACSSFAVRMKAFANLCFGGVFQQKTCIPTPYGQPFCFRADHIIRYTFYVCTLSSRSMLLDHMAQRLTHMSVDLQVPNSNFVVSIFLFFFNFLNP